jgi:hypothetical protein
MHEGQFLNVKQILGIPRSQNINWMNFYSCWGLDNFKTLLLQVDNMEQIINIIKIGLMIHLLISSLSQTSNIIENIKTYDKR